MLSKLGFSFFLVLSAIAFCALDVWAQDATASQKQAEDSAPIDEVKNVVDQLVKAVEQFPGEENIKARRAKLREIITPKFDFAQMAKLSLGAHWKEVSATEQDEFVKVFSDLLASTYLARIENIRAKTVKIDNQNFSNPTQAIVNTTVTHKGDKFPINYRLVKGAQGWKVYDVVIENIGLVVNYRNEFSGIIRKEQFAGLMKRLKEKSAKQQA